MSLPEARQSRIQFVGKKVERRKGRFRLPLPDSPHGFGKVAVVPETGHDVPVNEWQIVSERGNIDLFRMVIVKHGAFYDIKDVAYFMPEHAGKIRHLFVIFRWMQDQPGNITFMPLDVKPFGLPYFFV